MTTERPMVPEATPRSYYERPVIKAPVWRWFIPAYFFAGGLSAGSALIAFAADRPGRRRAHPLLARRSRVVAAAAMAAGGGLLVADLGRPERFAHMLRVAKPTSPMSVGSWLVAAYGPAAGLAAACEVLGVLPRLGRGASGVSAALAPMVATYTGVLLADTSVPAWHGGRAVLPFAGAAGAAASAAGVTSALVPVAEAGPVRRLAIGAAVAEVAAHRALDAAAGPAIAPAYHAGRAGRLRRLAEGLLVGGAALVATADRAAKRRPGRRAGRSARLAAVTGGLAVAAGAAMDRWALVEAGAASARDPAFTVGPQRARLDRRRPAPRQMGLEPS